MKPFLADPDVELYCGDALELLKRFHANAFDSCVTSPPYLDARPEYPSPSAEEFRDIFDELRRVVSGSLLLNVGRLWKDGKELLWWRELIAIAGAMGWPLRDTLVWIKPNANPIGGSILANSHEYVFLFGDGFDPDAVRTEYRARPRSFVPVYVGREKGNPHPAPMPLELAQHLVKLAGGKVILDPFAGSGTTLLAARSLGGRYAVGLERDERFCTIAALRLSQQSLLAGEAVA